MKKKVAFWVVMILVNAAVGVVSVRTYQNLEARVSSVEISNKKINDILLRILGADEIKEKTNIDLHKLQHNFYEERKNK